ncbi:MAG: DUF262 domain-containing protein [Dehalococcoidia bacterium]|nr:DUF262 domain-containing protein [Dehalococcoidia bacterium]
MEEVKPLSYPINDFFNWHKRQELVLQPKFQRRQVWSEKARSYLIDTILRRLPIPKLYMREMIDMTGHRTVREIVDGQQRMSTVIDYISGKFSVNKAQNEDYGGLHFHELPKDVQEKFLRYRFSVDLLEGATDRDVLEVFSRINSYTITLNAQEKRNAKFVSPFKRTIYDLGFEHYRFWLDNKIMTNQNIARMLEAELVSELVIAMLAGFQSGKKTINKYYLKYEENEFTQQERIIQRFRSTIDQIAMIFENHLSKTNFKRKPLFYSLFCFIFDAKFGLPGQNSQRLIFEGEMLKTIQRILFEMDKEITVNWKNPNDIFLHFIRVSQKSTADLGSRRIRHDFIWKYIISRLR